MTLLVIGAGHVVRLSFTIIFKKLHPAFCNNMMMLEKKINELKSRVDSRKKPKLFLTKVFCN